MVSSRTEFPPATHVPDFLRSTTQHLRASHDQQPFRLAVVTFTVAYHVCRVWAGFVGSCAAGWAGLCAVWHARRRRRIRAVLDQPRIASLPDHERSGQRRSSGEVTATRERAEGPSHCELRTRSAPPGRVSTATPPAPGAGSITSTFLFLLTKARCRAWQCAQLQVSAATHCRRLDRLPCPAADNLCCAERLSDPTCYHTPKSMCEAVIHRHVCDPVTVAWPVHRTTLSGFD